MHKPKISIITPSYNQGQFIEETILSVLNQDYENLEYIIMDGGSTDNTVEIIKKHEDKITFWVSEKDNGQTDAINKGFAKATGNIIAWINSDDVYCAGAFDAIADTFEKNPEVNVVVGNMLFMNAEGNVYIRKHPNISKLLEKNAIMSILQPSTFFRRKILTDVGYLNEEYQMIMDVEWYSRINRKYPFFTIGKDISKFRWHDASKSSSNHNSKLYKRYMEELAHVMTVIYPRQKNIINKYPISSFYLHVYAGRIIRIWRRLIKGELHKLKDTNV